ncbi:hypothetical protein NSB26_13940, partial [Phocaeicola sartorii]|uniref:hypothetical protein n=1 Tax=Phocaeicola sartorii TaxID=671267 RepID=UPI00214CAA47
YLVMISVDAFKMNKADRTHHQLRTPAPDTSPEKNSRKAPGIRKENEERWWQQPFLPRKKKCCHHPLKRPVHRGFSKKGGGSGSTFIKPREGRRERGKINHFIIFIFNLSNLLYFF